MSEKQLFRTSDVEKMNVRLTLVAVIRFFENLEVILSLTSLRNSVGHYILLSGDLMKKQQLHRSQIFKFKQKEPELGLLLLARGQGTVP